MSTMWEEKNYTFEMVLIISVAYQTRRKVRKALHDMELGLLYNLFPVVLPGRMGTIGRVCKLVERECLGKQYPQWVQKTFLLCCGGLATLQNAYISSSIALSEDCEDLTMGWGC